MWTGQYYWLYAYYGNHICQCKAEIKVIIYPFLYTCNFSCDDDDDHQTTFAKLKGYTCILQCACEKEN